MKRFHNYKITYFLLSYQGGVVQHTLRFHGLSQKFDAHIKKLDKKNIKNNSNAQNYERLTTPNLEVSFMLTPNTTLKKKLRM